MKLVQLKVHQYIRLPHAASVHITCANFGINAQDGTYKDFDIRLAYIEPSKILTISVTIP